MILGRYYRRKWFESEEKVIVRGWRYYHRLTSSLGRVVLDTIEKRKSRRENLHSIYLEILSRKVFGSWRFLIVFLLIITNTTNTNNNPIRAYACVWGWH